MRPRVTNRCSAYRSHHGTYLPKIGPVLPKVSGATADASNASET
jgi:hypothetical protein